MTELIWDGKYDAEGRRVAPLRVRLPFQTVETVNESAQERNLALDLFQQGRDPEWRNRLIWGDKKYVLPALLAEFAGKVDLIYIDPPFDTGADFSFSTNIPLDITGGGGEITFEKEPSIIEQKAYRDIWGRGPTHLDSYLQWFYETAILLRDLLADYGSIYVHCDWRIDSAVRLLMDEVFGADGSRNTITWKRDAPGKGAKKFSKQWPRNTDSILFYTKSDQQWHFSQAFVPLNDEQKKAYRYRNTDGRLYKAVQLGDYSPTSIARFETEGLIHTTSSGTKMKKYFLDEAVSTIDCIWTDILGFGTRTGATEQTGYPTQKPEALLERIIKASSNEGDLVLDCFAGSGTTAAVAEKLGRRWITADLGRFAIHTTRKRLLGIENVKPFVVQNLGKYERQVWQAAEFGAGAGAAAAQAYRAFILDLYRARALDGYVWLHGLRNGRMVHVGSVDAPIAPGDVTNIVAEFARAVGTGADAPAERGVDVLGWDFAFELHEVAKQQAARAGIDVRFVRIPREVLEKKAVEQGDIRFFELAALNVDVAQQGRAVTLTLTDFVIPLDDVPEEVQRAITHWSQWVDYWAVDWENKSDTFHNEWQTYRTRKDRDLKRTTTHTYAAPGTYRIMVKVIDLLGNDTTKTLEVTV